MPQPLSRVKTVTSLDISNGPWDNPEIATRVSEIFGQWASIDHQLNLLIVRILGADAKPALAMFDTVTSDALARTMRLAAAKAALPEQEFMLFRAILMVAESAYAQRNKFAHWLWAQSGELPNTLLLADPTYMVQKDRQWIDVVAGQTQADEATFKIDHNHILVYTIPDLDRTVTDMRQAKDAVASYGMLPLLISFPEMHESMRQQLLNRHPVRMAMDRLRAGQQSE